MDFGIYLRNQVTYENMLNRARKAEQLGFRGGYLNDHVIGFANDGREEYLEAWTAMTGIGVQTSKLRIGQIVLFNSLRNPAFLAKSVTTLDHMIDGRFDLLIGAGWNEREYLGYDLMEGGFGMPSARERVDRLKESLIILDLMLKQETSDYEGDFWKLENAINSPLPKRSIPITVGCSGSRMMRITARYAAGINHSTRELSKLHANMKRFEAIHERIALFEDIVPWKDFEISGFSAVRIARNPSEKEDMVSELANTIKKDKASVEEEILVGTPDELNQKFARLIDAGMQWMVIVPLVHKKSDADALEIFHDDVMKAL